MTQTERSCVSQSPKLNGGVGGLRVRFVSRGASASQRNENVRGVRGKKQENGDTRPFGRSQEQRHLH